MQKPDENAYKKDKSGNLVLDETKFVSNPIDSTGQVFFDSNLTFFKTLNAFYTPESAFGKIKANEQVNLMPGTITLLDKNPFVILAILAHESGHKLGQMVSRINGYDLSQEYTDLLNCYKDSKSIKLQDSQIDETLADYFSSEVLARQIQKLPVDKRKIALQSSMAGYCFFDDTSNHQHLIMCKENHPQESLRVSGIFGSNPSIRKVIGCQKDSSNYKTCGLKVSILDLPASNSLIAAPITKNPADTNSSKGVR